MSAITMEAYYFKGGREVCARWYAEHREQKKLTVRAYDSRTKTLKDLRRRTQEAAHGQGIFHRLRYPR